MSEAETVLRVELARQAHTIAQLTADVHGRDLCIASLNDALELSESCKRSAEATIRELQAAIRSMHAGEN